MTIPQPQQPPAQHPSTSDLVCLAQYYQTHSLIRMKLRQACDSAHQRYTPSYLKLSSRQSHHEQPRQRAAVKRAARSVHVYPLAQSVIPAAPSLHCRVASCLTMYGCVAVAQLDALLQQRTHLHRHAQVHTLPMHTYTEGSCAAAQTQHIAAHSCCITPDQLAEPRSQPATVPGLPTPCFVTRHKRSSPNAAEPAPEPPAQCTYTPRKRTYVCMCSRR